MKVFWQQCEGQTIDGFPLRQYLGGGEDQAVFLTELNGDATRKAVIKLTHADPDSTENQLRRWRLAAELAHPNLVRLFERGTWQLNNVTLLYVVMEYADEDLSQVIPERSLSIEEAKEVLVPALDALAYLHSNGLVHGRLKPSNFMAIDGRLKLSSDAVVQMGAGSLTPADDVWSLGMTLVEIVTQRLPVWSATETRDPVLPDTLPAEFREIARNALRRDPGSRWTVAEIQQQLLGTAVRANSRVYATVAGSAVLVILLAMVAGTLLVRHRELAQVTPSVNKPAETQIQPVQTEIQPQTKPAPAAARATVPEPPPPQSETKSPSPARPVEGEILQQVLPDVLARARNSIHGKVAVGVRVQVDASGEVTGATLESPGPSQYFAGLALKAAQRWKFAPADVTRVWILRFEFTRTGTKIAPLKTAPRP